MIAPSLISQNYKKNYIEIEDFGDLTVFKKFKKKTANKKNYYKNILDLLLKIKKIKIKNQKTFLKTNFKVPNYTSKMLLDESNLFIDWYLQKYFKGKKKRSIEKELKIIFKKLLRNISYNKKVFVHRDFHISNIMITKRGLGLIDSQDAVYGNIAYDLASLSAEGLQRPDIADRAQVESDASIQLRTRDRERKLISKIDAALRRIDLKTYGYCEETGEPIGLGRLKARPIASLSVDAQERHEKMEKIHKDE